MTTRPRQLRRAASIAENRLWYVLRNRGLNGLKFVRQMPVGSYIADFACREAALIVELDGGQHADSVADEARTAFLNREGYSVLRFWNNEVLSNRDGVLSTILRVIEGSPSPDLRFAPATLSPRGRGRRGARAADGANFLNQARSVLLPLGEKVARPQGETDEGALLTKGNTA
ncbi:endonuclease domain-containing protein [Devosia sp. PTR5]|uniref:Endonuclease domain-containing protein n=1 Tax=Devosia oryzisoli TaxID=2774138 RepID=A0A927ITZ8_9HYPH|nr:endonuclease domain-containing protein [Devosia oryzisoli]